VALKKKETAFGHRSNSIGVFVFDGAKSRSCLLD
jgi:hypothetical protein